MSKVYSEQELLYLTNHFHYDLETDTLYRKYKSGWREAKLSRTTGGYLRVAFPANRHITVHRLIWLLVYGELPELEIDHKDGDRQNNRLENLRLVTRIQNQSNRLPNKNCRSRYKGVYRHQNKWVASISFNGKRYYLGLFNCETSAALAYNKKAEEFNDNFRRIN